MGVGATGAASASLLARAGVGHLTLIDRDFVEPSNLQRQILFDEADALAALPKAEAARRKIATFNSAVEVEAVIADLVPANIHALLAPADLLLDCTDNFETRYLLNDYAVQQGKPWIYTAAVGAYAATMTILPARNPGAPRLDFETWVHEPTACLSCIFPTPPAGPVETCDTAGILSTGREPRRLNPIHRSSETSHAPAATPAPHPALLRPLEQPARGDFSLDLQTRPAPSATPASSLISPAKAAHTSPSAGATPCRFTSITGPSISLRWSFNSVAKAT